jgi:hypothetical protein
MNGRIRARDIERDLVAMLKERSPGEIRSMLFTLIVVEPAGTEDRGHVEALLGKRPARLIWLETGLRGPSTASVSARCLLDREDRSICLEEVHLGDGEDGAARAAGTWVPLLIRDLPAILLYRGSPAGLRALAEEAKGAVDLCVFDGEKTGVVGPPCPGGTATTGLALPLTDLGWERGLAARKAAALLFQEPSIPERSGSIERVELRAPNAYRGGLFARWLSERLELPIERISIAPAGAEPDSWRCDFHFDGGASASFAFGADGAGIMGGNGKLRPFAAEIEKDEDILLRIVDAPGPDPLYAKALEKRG